MKFILIPVIWLMLPIAFLFVAFDVAKSFVQDKLIFLLKEHNK
jgi:hypothetical protein